MRLLAFPDLVDQLLIAHKCVVCFHKVSFLALLQVVKRKYVLTDFDGIESRQNVLHLVLGDVLVLRLWILSVPDDVPHLVVD